MKEKTFVFNFIKIFTKSEKIPLFPFVFSNHGNFQTFHALTSWIKDYELVINDIFVFPCYQYQENCWADNPDSSIALKLKCLQLFGGQGHRSIKVKVCNNQELDSICDLCKIMKKLWLKRPWPWQNFKVIGPDQRSWKGMLQIGAILGCCGSKPRSQWNDRILSIMLCKIEWKFSGWHQIFPNVSKNTIYVVPFSEWLRFVRPITGYFKWYIQNLRFETISNISSLITRGVISVDIALKSTMISFVLLTLRTRLFWSHQATILCTSSW